MAGIINIAVPVRKTLFDVAERLAQPLNISRGELFGRVVEDFIKNHQGHQLPEAIKKEISEQFFPGDQEDIPSSALKAVSNPDRKRITVKQGDIFWVPLDAVHGADPGTTHPHVVLQDDVINQSRIDTLVVCALTSNLKRVQEPGNILLEPAEANLSRPSVIVVSQVSTVDRTQLAGYIGSLSQERIHQIFAGMQLLQKMAGHSADD
jgi:mRNA interferase MazF